MKARKLMALVLALIMVVSMIPVMALTSSAAEEFALSTYGNGCETWSNGKTGKPQTHLMVGLPSETWQAYKAQVTYTALSLDLEGALAAPTLEGGKIELTIKDYSSEARTVTCVPSNDTSTLSNGATTLLYFMTAEYADPQVPIQIGNQYTVTDVKLYVGDEVAYQSTGKLLCTWAPGNEDPNDKIFVGGEAPDPQPTYDGPIPDLFPEEPITVDWVTYNNLWFEKHDTWGRVLMIGFPTTTLPEDVTAAKVVEASRVEVTWADGTKQVMPEFANGANASFAIGDNTLFRVKCDPLPPVGLQEGCKVEFVRKTDDKVLFTGTCDIDCEVYEDPTWMEDEPTPATLSRYFDGETDWTKYGDEDVLAVKMSGILDLADVHSNTVTWDVQYDGAPVDRPIRTIIDTAEVAEDGTYTVVLYLGIPLPEADGTHTVQATISYEGDTMYTTEPLTVTYTSDVDPGPAPEPETQSFTSGTYGSGAESWAQNATDADGAPIAIYNHTQFLITIPKDLWYGPDGLPNTYEADDGEGIDAKVGFHATRYNQDTKEWEDGGITSGKFVLTITDYLGVPQEIVCPPTTVGGVGDVVILRFETADYGEPAYQILANDMYTVQLSIYLDAAAEKPNYIGSEVKKIKFSGDKMYSHNEEVTPLPTYDGPIPDAYETPVELDWETYNDTWFEEADGWGKVMLVMIPNNLIPELSSVQDIIDTAKVVVTWPDGTTDTYESFGKDGANGYYAFEERTLFRVSTDPFPAIYTGEEEFDPASMIGTKIEFVRKSDDKVMFTGTVPAPTPEGGTLGDIDGNTKIDASDRSYLARALAGWDGYTVPDASVGDLDANGEVNASDRSVLARHLAGWEGYETLPVVS